MKQIYRIKIDKKNIKNKNIIEILKFMDKDLEFDVPKKINLKNLDNDVINELNK